MAIRHQARALQPKATVPSAPEVAQERTSFYDLPAELRVEIYRLALETVTINITNPKTPSILYRPLPLRLASRRIHTEVRPIMLQKCSITCRITDLDFDPLHTWLDRMAATEALLRRPAGGVGGSACLNDIEASLARNDRLYLMLSFSSKPARHLDCRRWLHDRADPCRPQPRWTFVGDDTVPPGVLADLRRRRRRMAVGGKRKALEHIMDGIERIPSLRRRR